MHEDRPTIHFWDLLIIAGCVMLSLSWCATGQVSLHMQPRIVQNWLADTSGSELCAAAFVLGLAIAGPLVIVAQFARGGRTSMSIGDWLWIAPAMTGVVAAMALLLAQWCAVKLTGPILAASALVIAGCSIYAGCRLFGDRARTSMTDMLGTTSCLSVGVFAVYTLLAHPLAD